MQKTVLTVGGLALAILLTGALVGYASGYRIGPNFSIVEVGAIEVRDLLAGAHVFIDDSEVGTAEANGTTMAVGRITPGARTVIVSREGYWPWLKTVEVHERTTTAIGAFQVPTQSTGEIITSRDPEYRTILSRFTTTKIPTATTPVISGTKNVAVWVEKGVIKAKWQGSIDAAPSYFCQTECGAPITILTPTVPARSVHFYKDREDVLVVGVQDGVYALDIDTREPQNFQPIYKGSSPLSVPVDSNSVYIRDGATLMQVVY